MNMERWVDPRVRQVRMADVQRYLLGHGWRSEPYPRPELLVYEGPPDDDGNPIVQVLPAEHCSDFREGVTRLITNLSVVEDRHPADVLTDILRPGPAGPPDGAGAATPAVTPSPTPT